MKKVFYVITVLFAVLLLGSCSAERISSANAPLKVRSYELDETLVLTLEKGTSVFTYSVEKFEHKRYDMWSEKTKERFGYGFKFKIQNVVPVKIRVEYSVDVLLAGNTYYSESTMLVLEPNSYSNSPYIKISDEDFEINLLDLQFEVRSVEIMY